jgi:hypothetical protein
VNAKLPESREEFEAIERRFMGDLDIARKTLQNAQARFDQACNEYADWKRECRKKGYR